MQEKKQIHIQVRNKIATFVSMNFTLVGGNNDYEVVFDFDSEWAKYPVKTALFVYANETKKVVIDGNTCEGIPIEKATLCLIGAFAGDIYTTTPACIRDIKLSIRDMATSLPEPPTEDVYNQLMELLNKYIQQGGGGGGVSFVTDETLTLKDGVLSVNVADVAETDNTLPISSAAVATAVGDIEVLLKTI
jgi:hypothetical protein